jgi:Flp pilus assembly secretin CpaC
MRLNNLVAGLALAMAASAAAADPIEVTVNKGHLLPPLRNAEIVLIAEPSIASAVVETPGIVFILGRQPGETNLFVMDRTGRILVQKDVVVVPNEPRQVTIYRSATETTLSCAPRCAGAAAPNSGVATDAPRSPAAPAPATPSSSPRPTS